jgi:DNA-binding CsgD family transcriptional regulator
MTLRHDDRAAQDDRLLLMLQRLLGIQSLELRSTLDAASTIIAETFGADKVDVFVYHPDRDRLVAMGTSRTPLGQRQKALGLDCLPLTNGGRTAWAFREGVPYVTGRADLDPEELRGIVEDLGVLSVMSHPFTVGGERRGVLQVDSVRPNFFSERDQCALGAVSGWVGLIMHRAELVEQSEARAERRGSRRAGDDLAKLTRRQQEVAACLAEGLTNAEIARRLVLTPGTVANHLENILRRLDLKSRTHVAVWAVERGLFRSDQEGSEAADRPTRQGRHADRGSDDGVMPTNGHRRDDQHDIPVLRPMR